MTSYPALIPFYRVQDIHNNGPYSDSAPRVLPGFTTPEHPAPRLDGLDLGWIVLRQHFFGFQSEQQLNAWMLDGGYLAALEAHTPDRWRIYEYTLDSRIVHHGGHQSIALKAAVEDCIRVRDWTVPAYIERQTLA